MKTELDEAVEWFEMMNSITADERTIKHTATIKRFANQERRTFAAMAMQGMCANSDFTCCSESDIATRSERQADALILVLNRRSDR